MKNKKKLERREGRPERKKERKKNFYISMQRLVPILT